MTDTPAPSSPGPRARRVFFALQLTEKIREALAELSDRLQKAAHFTPVVATWVPPRNFHLTLHFLGAVPEPVVQQLLAGLPEAVRGIDPFAMEVRGIGFFPNPRAPRVLWAGIHNAPPELKRVLDAVGRLAVRHGVELEHDNFHAHVTLARFKSVKGTGAFVKNADSQIHARIGDCRIAKVHLMESILSDGAPEYVSLGSASLLPA